MKIYLTIALWMVCAVVLAQNGPFSPGADQAGSEAIHYTDARILQWASECHIQRGYMDIANPSLGYAATGDSSMALGPANGQAVSLGDAGVALVVFDSPIENIDGPDFAVFENGFKVAEDKYFLELGHVEVSSNGTDFIRFPSQSLTQTDNQTPSYESLDPTQIDGLAGKYATGYGAPFDLSDLQDSASLDIDSVRFVRIVDVVGSIDPQWGSTDVQGRLINDPYPTDFVSGGFDLDAVCTLGVVNGIEDHSSNVSIRVYPNPAQNQISLTGIEGLYKIVDLSGRTWYQGTASTVDISEWPTGAYLLKTTIGNQTFIKE